MPRDDQAKPEDEVEDSSETEGASKLEPGGGDPEGQRTGEVQAAANREVDPPA